MAIFTLGGEPLRFFMSPCAAKSAVQSQVQAHGGVMLNKHSADCIELVGLEPSFRLKAECAKLHPVYSYRLVPDSVQQGRLAALSDYELHKAFPVAKAAAADVRRKYTTEDNERMIYYARKVPGNASNYRYWEHALSHGLDVSHSAHSLRFHWDHVIQKRLLDDNKRKTRLDPPAVKRMRLNPLPHS